MLQKANFRVSNGNSLAIDTINDTVPFGQTERAAAGKPTQMPWKARHLMLRQCLELKETLSERVNYTIFAVCIPKTIVSA